MSHTRILDKIGQRFVNLPSAESRSKPFLEGAAKMRESGNENRQESDFNCKAFVDVSAEVIAQFFE
jgi:hypothetical protein